MPKMKTGTPLCITQHSGLLILKLDIEIWKQDEKVCLNLYKVVQTW